MVKAVFSSPEEKARKISYGIMKSMTETPSDVTLDKIKLVWFTKTLQNWKAMVAGIYPGGLFIEVTYNGDKQETYFDVYKKIENIRIPD